MCGIVGIVGQEAVAQRLFDGLKRLEYRGYDSAGICTVQGHEFERRRAEGKLDNLARELAAVDGADPRGIVAAIFEPLEPVEQALRDVRFPDNPDNPAHTLPLLL